MVPIRFADDGARDIEMPHRGDGEILDGSGRGVVLVAIPSAFADRLRAFAECNGWGFETPEDVLFAGAREILARYETKPPAAPK